MILMDRRTFTGFALAGLGLAALPAVARAAVLTPKLPENLKDRPYLPLLERARAALETHHDSFELRDRVALADFGVASRELRFHIVDLIGGQNSSYLVAHGKGSDPEHSGWLQTFSNEPNSLATSDGTFKSGEIYEGVHGQSMRLLGLDPCNSNAEPRAIVIHGADYVTENHIATWGKCGRSEGCFAVAPHMLAEILAMLGPGRMLYAAKLPAPDPA
jgi:hypothetical protein